VHREELSKETKQNKKKKINKRKCPYWVIWVVAVESRPFWLTNPEIISLVFFGR
jgi:hypothetical protein